MLKGEKKETAFKFLGCFLSWCEPAALGDISTGIKEVPEEGGRKRRGEKGGEPGFFHVRLYLGAIRARRMCVLESKN